MYLTRCSDIARYHVNNNIVQSHQNYVLFGWNKHKTKLYGVFFLLGPISMIFLSLLSFMCGKVRKTRERGRERRKKWIDANDDVLFFHQNWMMPVHIQTPYKINVRLYAYSYEVRKFNMEKKHDDDVCMLQCHIHVYNGSDLNSKSIE